MLMCALPKFPINVTFDPAKNDYSAELWSVPAGQILMLLWRPMHLCSLEWFVDATIIAARIESKRPASMEALIDCFKPQSDGHADFTEADVKEFCSLAIDFFTGKKHVPYQGIVSGNAAMIRK